MFDVDGNRRCPPFCWISLSPPFRTWTIAAKSSFSLVPISREKLVFPLIKVLIFSMHSIQFFFVQLHAIFCADLIRQSPKLFGDEFVKRTHQWAVIRTDAANRDVVWSQGRQCNC